MSENGLEPEPETREESQEELSKPKVIAAVVALVVLVGISLFFVFGGGDEEEEESPDEQEQQAPEEENQEPEMDEELESEGNMEGQVPPEEFAEDVEEEDLGTEGQNQQDHDWDSIAQSFMEDVNNADDGEELRDSAETDITTALDASLQYVESDTFPSEDGDEISIDDSSSGAVATVSDSDGEELYTFNMYGFPSEDADADDEGTPMVETWNIPDPRDSDDPADRLDESGHPIEAPVFPLSEDGAANYRSSSVPVVRAFVEYDGQATEEERTEQAEDAVNGGDVPDVRNSNLGREAEVRMYAPENMRLLNEIEGDDIQTDQVSVGMTVYVANLRASENVIDEFDIAVDYEFNDDLGYWQPSGMRMLEDFETYEDD